MKLITVTKTPVIPGLNRKIRELFVGIAFVENQVHEILPLSDLLTAELDRFFFVSAAHFYNRIRERDGQDVELKMYKEVGIPSFFAVLKTDCEVTELTFD